MKYYVKIISLGTLFLLYALAGGQEMTEDFFSEGKTWSVIVANSLPFGVPEYALVYEPMHMRVEGQTDTLGFVWKKLVNDDGYPFLYRQDGQKVYGYNELDSIFLRFDFGLQKGDTVLTYTYIPDIYVVDSVFGAVFGLEKKKRKCLSVHNTVLERVRDVWVEGFGSLSAGMLYYHSRWAGGQPSLLCVEENGTNVYRDTLYKTCDIPAHLSYDYSIQNWSVLCRDKGQFHTELMHFKEEGRKQWNRAYCATQENFSDEKPYGWFYQDMLQVYYKENENDTAFLLYDFGLEKGERFLSGNQEMWTVDSVYYEKIDGLKRRCQRMVSEHGEVDTWIEGIGSLKTGFFPADFAGGHDDVELLCVQADVFWHRNYMYHNAGYNTCYIGEETSEEQDTRTDIGVRYHSPRQTLVIESSVEVERLEVMDAQGRCVLRVNHPSGSVSVAHLPRGLYLYRLTANATTLSGKFVR